MRWRATGEEAGGIEIWEQPSNFMRAQRYIVKWFENKGQIEGLTVEEESSGASE